MSLPRWMLPVAAGVAGLAIGIVVPRGTEGVSPPVPRAEPGAPGSTAATPAATFTLDDVRRVVREELLARDGDRASPAARPGVAEEAGAPAPAQAAAAVRAAATLDAAIVRHAWTEADSDALREDFNGMSAEQRAEWLRQYAVAVNQGRLVPESERGPL